MSCIIFGHGVQKRRLPRTGNNATVFMCTLLKCRLTVSACAARSVAAEKLTESEQWKASCCRTCAIGRRNRSRT